LVCITTITIMMTTTTITIRRNSLTVFIPCFCINLKIFSRNGV
jgi:hypothetical protein